MGKRRKKKKEEKIQLKMKQLEHENTILKRKAERLYKRLQREAKKSPSKLTPRKKVDVQLRKQGINPSKVKHIRKQLIYGEVLTEIRLAFEERKNKRKGLRNIVSGKILKKYKLLKFSAMKLKTDRRHLSRTASKLSLVPRKERKKNEQIIHSVQEFFLP